MKKQYMTPDMLVVGIETCNLMAGSLPLSDKGDGTTGGALAPGYEDDFDDEEEEGDSWGYKKY